jgi:hypothetical protein
LIAPTHPDLDRTVPMLLKDILASVRPLGKPAPGGRLPSIELAPDLTPPETGVVVASAVPSADFSQMS